MSSRRVVESARLYFYIDNNAGTLMNYGARYRKGCR